MATIEVTMGRAGARAANGQGVGVMLMDGAVSQSLGSSGISTQTTIVAPGTQRDNCVAHIKVTGGNVRVARGTNPTATGTDLILFADSALNDFGIRPGDKLAFIDA